MFSFSTKPAVSKDEAMKEQVRKWQSELRTQTREIDRQIRAIDREVEKVKREIKIAAGKGEVAIVKQLARQIVNARGAITRMTVSKAHIHSVSMSLQTQAATMRVAGTMGKSADVMKAMGRLINAPEIGAVMRKMGEEMTKAGIVEEIMADSMDSIAADGEEAETDEVVQQVMYEVTQGLMGTAPPVPIGGLPTAAKAPAAAAPAPTRRVAVPEGGAAAAAAPPPGSAAGGAAGGDGDMADILSRLDKM